MAEIQLTRIRSIYGDLKGLHGEIPEVGKAYFVPVFTVSNFNATIDQLSALTDTDYSAYKVVNIRIDERGYPLNIVRTQVGRIVARLREEYGFDGSGGEQVSPSIVIFNKNQNEISLQINYTLNDLIAKTEDEEGKDKLNELKSELEKPSKSWEKIRSILIWILNFSKELFLEVLPILLQKKL